MFLLCLLYFISADIISFWIFCIYVEFFYAWNCLVKYVCCLDIIIQFLFCATTIPLVFLSSFSCIILTVFGNFVRTGTIDTQAASIAGIWRQVVKEDIREMTKIFMQVNGLTATSTKSEREYHQEDFKKKLRDRYQCAHESNPDLTRCTILNSFFPTNQIIAAHLIGLTNRKCLSFLNLDAHNDLWNERNGLLIHAEFERRYEAQEIVRIFLTCTTLFCKFSRYFQISEKYRHSYTILILIEFRFKCSMMMLCSNK